MESVASIACVNLVFVWKFCRLIGDFMLFYAYFIDGDTDKLFFKLFIFIPPLASTCSFRLPVIFFVKQNWPEINSRKVRVQITQRLMFTHQRGAIDLSPT